MNLAKTLLDRHLFILTARNITKNIVVYKTCNGPIFCVWGTTGMIKRYLREGNKSLITLNISHDFNKTSTINEAKLLANLQESFPQANHIDLLNKIKHTAEDMNNEKKTKEIEKRLKGWNPKYDPGKTHKELTKEGTVLKWK